MVDLPQKTRHAVEMACAARALARAAPSSHLKRMLARHVFVHLHDVVKFAAAWRNQLLKDERTEATAGAALPSLARLRRDWANYQDIRHFLAAKRQLRNPNDAASDQLAVFELWSDIGQLSVETLVDDAVELYAQLAASERAGAIDPDPVPPDAVAAVLETVEAIGEGFLEANASTFGAAKPNTVAIRMGGHIGRLIPLVNDVAESASILAKLASGDDLDGPINRLVVCALPSEISELLRLTIGPPLEVQQHTSDTTSLLAYYRQPQRPPDALTVLENLNESIPQPTQEELLDWRNRIGAHTDEDTPWSVLEAGIEAVDLASYVELFEWVELNLEHVACTAGGPILLMLGSRHFKTLVPGPADERGLVYEDTDSQVKPGDLQSALPPAEADSEYIVWVSGPEGSRRSAAMAGMIAARGREVIERLEAFRKRHESGE
jgi:hypothetical protein